MIFHKVIVGTEKYDQQDPDREDVHDAAPAALKITSQHPRSPVITKVKKGQKRKRPVTGKQIADMDHILGKGNCQHHYGNRQETLSGVLAEAVKNIKSAASLKNRVTSN